MIDLIYKTLLTIINKENQGYVSPTEYNLLLNNVQQEIFRSYFEDENVDKNRENRGLTNRGYSHLSFNQRQRITQFSDISLITATAGSSPFSSFEVPQVVYFIEHDGVSTISGKVLDEVERNSIVRMLGTEVAPTELYPVYESYGDVIRVYPNTFKSIEIRYIRNPKMPKWTYFVLPDGSEVFNPSSPDFQDIELHQSEFTNIVLRLLSYFSINLREGEVIQIAETLKDKMNLKDNS
jgi:hypothetical protein